MTALEIAEGLNANEMYGRILKACSQIDTFLAQDLGLERPIDTNTYGLEKQFETLAEGDQAQVYRSILSYHNLIAGEIEKGTDVADGIEFTRASLQILGLRTSDAIFKYIHEDSVVEHFTMDFRQTWRSISFFKFSSYPVRTLFLRPFPENFKKSPERVHGQIVTALEKLDRGDAMFLTDITEEHEIVEVDSPLRIRNVGTAKFVAPTFYEGRRHGIISVIDVRQSSVRSL